MNCKQCGQPIIKRKTFCNSSCSAKFNNSNRCRNKWTEEQRKEFSKRRSNLKPRKLFDCLCIICGTAFRHRLRKESCSLVCKKQIQSERAKLNPNCGGETNYKRYSYKDVVFDSSWEVDIAKFLDEKQIKWFRSRSIILYWVDSTGSRRRYYPDFYLPDLDMYLDPKNLYKQSLDSEKIAYIKSKYNLICGTVNEIKAFFKMDV